MTIMSGWLMFGGQGGGSSDPVVVSIDSGDIPTVSIDAADTDLSITTEVSVEINQSAIVAEAGDAIEVTK